MYGIDSLNALIGRWSGSGKGNFPRIHPFRYREDLVFAKAQGRPEITVSQNTFKVLPDGSEEPSHLEVGLLYESAQGQIVWHNVQTGGRLELMYLRDYVPDAHWFFVSERILNDPKPRYAVGSERLIRLEENQLSYVMNMTTAEETTPLVHLEARLRKVD